MRRRSASAQSTAAVRLVSARVTWAASSASWVGPSRRARHRMLSRCDAHRDPRRDEHQADDADGHGEPRPAVLADLEEVELRRVPGQPPDVGRQRGQGERAAPRRGGQGEADRPDRQERDVVADLPPARLGLEPLAEPPSHVGRVSGGIGSAIGSASNALARDRSMRPSPRRHHERDPGHRDREQERQQQPDAQGAERDHHDERDDPHRQPEGDPGTGPEQLAWPPPGGEGIGHDGIQSAQSVATASRMSSRAARRAGRIGGDDAGDGGEDEHDGERRHRGLEDAEALLGVDRPHQAPAEERADGEPADRAEDGDDHRLPPHGGAQLAAALADGAQQPELTGALVDRQRQRVADAHHGDQHGDGEQPVDHGQHRVDLAARPSPCTRRGSGDRAPSSARSPPPRRPARRPSETPSARSTNTTTSPAWRACGAQSAVDITRSPNDIRSV